MSYPSINGILEGMGVTNETATDDQRYVAFVSAFEQDLTLGWNAVGELTKKLKDGEDVAEFKIHDLASDVCKQFIRLMGPDIPNQILSKYYDGLVFHLIDFGHGIVARNKESAENFLSGYEVQNVCDLKKMSPMGWEHVNTLVEKLAKDNFNSRQNLILDPLSDDGIEFTRLLASTPHRRAIENHFDCSLGFYNCCRGVGGGDEETVGMSMKTQIEAQDPQFVDC